MTLETRMTGPQYDGLKKPEEKKEIKKVSQPPGLEVLTQIFLKHVEEFIPRGLEDENEIPDGIRKVLTPDYISYLPTYFSQFYNIHENAHQRIATFINTLIQISYKGGNNNFQLNVRNHLFSSIGTKLHGTEENPLKLTIKGKKIGPFQGERAHFCYFKNDGQVLGKQGEMAMDCTFENLKDTKSCGSSSRGNTFILHGNIIQPYVCDSMYNTFVVYSKDAFEQMKSGIDSRAPNSNTIILMNEKGKELKRAQK